MPIGGGLISGVGTVLTVYDPASRAIGVQPEGAARAKPSLEAGEVRGLEDVNTVGLEGSGSEHLDDVLEALDALERCRFSSGRSTDRADSRIAVRDREFGTTSILFSMIS